MQKKQRPNKQNKAVYLLGVLLVLGMLLFVSCGEEGEEKTKPTSAPTAFVSATPGTTQGTLPEPTEEPLYNIGDKEEIFYYTVNPDELEVEAISSVVGSDFSNEPESILFLVSMALEDAGYDLGIDKVIVENKNAVVCFRGGEVPVRGLEIAEEKVILDAIAQSLLDNSDGYNGVIFRIGDEAYVSDNYTFGTNYVYMKN